MINLINNNNNNNNRTKTSKKSSTKNTLKNNLNKLNKKTYIKKLKHSVKKNIKHYKPRSVEAYCKAFYKFDINGKPNKNLYNSCKIHKYCRKNKCKAIDDKIMKKTEQTLGPKYNYTIKSKLIKGCKAIQSIKNKNKCEIKLLKNLYNNYNMGDLYNKLIECDEKTCIKEKTIFYNNLFRINQFKLKKRQRILLEEQKKIEEPDMYLIRSGNS